MDEFRAKVLAKIAAAPAPSAEDILSRREHLARNRAVAKRRVGDPRGNNGDRRRRTARLLDEFGDGTACRCAYCPTVLTAATLTQDKIYTTEEGGRYVYANLLPSCLSCNSRRCNAVIHEFIAEAQAAIAQAEAQLT